MLRLLFIVTVAIASTLAAAPATQPDRLEQRGDGWQKILERNAFQFSEADANVLFALSQYGGKCQIHMIYDPARSSRITFKFVKDGEERLAIDGHTESVFRTVKNVLYFAHFSTSTQGCTVTAHDLETGAKLWETELNVVPPASHLAYSNKVTMGLSSLGGTEDKGEGIVSITGRESFGDYVAILDRQTGKVFAQKLYRRR